ncbi:unnamed protein product, partial [Prorocentrum cordatum]
MAVSSEHCKVMVAVGEYVEREWKKHGEDIAGKNGYKAAFYQGVRAARPPFPIFMYNIGLMPALSNGARVNLWGTPDPVCFPVLNVNHSQSRKSRLTSLAESAMAHVDSYVTKRLQHMFDAKDKAFKDIMAAKKRKTTRDLQAVETQAEGSLGAAGESNPNELDDGKSGGIFPGVWSHAFLGGTIERVRERCAGDFSVAHQTKAVVRLPSIQPEYLERAGLGDLDIAGKAMATQSGMHGRVWYGQGLVYDEIYQFLQDLSILDKPNEEKSGDGPGAGQTPLAGWLNRLVQSGKSDHETKSNGSHGGLASLPVSTSILGNFHPTPCIEMLRGERGDHGCQAKARVTVCTGLPVQPREMYVDLDGDECPADWVEIPPNIHSALGADNAFSSVNSFKAFFHVRGEDEETAEDVGAGEEDAAVRVRMRLGEGRYVPEWLLPRRDITIPAEADLGTRAAVLTEHCAQQGPHHEIVLSEAAKGKFASYSTYYNIMVKTARDANDPDKGAKNGIGPWKLGMIAACLLLADIMWNQVEFVYKGMPWVIQGTHMERAFKLAGILDGIRTAFRDDAAVERLAVGDIADALTATRADKELDNVKIVKNMPGTEIARRMLCKTYAFTVEDDGGSREALVVPASRAHGLWTVKEAKDRDVGKMSVHVFRGVANACPPKLGRYDADIDALVLGPEALPDGEPSMEFKEAQNNYANITWEQLCAAVDKNKVENRVRQEAAAA